jgi:hypothetical protein
MLEHRGTSPPSETEICKILKVEDAEILFVLNSSETSVLARTTWRNIPENGILYPLFCLFIHWPLPSTQITLPTARTILGLPEPSRQQS